MSDPSGLWAVVLAAGAGRRFGGGKLVHPLHGRPLLHHALDVAATAPVDGVLVAVGAERGEIEEALRDYAPPRPVPIQTVIVEDWAEGMAASLRAAIAALPPCRGAFVVLADMPSIPTAILGSLAEALDRGFAAAAPSFEGALGHPVLLSAALFPQVRALRGDRGARPILEALGSKLCRLPVDDPGVLRDVDRPADLDAVAGPQAGLRNAAM